MAYYCYLLECANGSFYTGWATDPARRLRQHNAGRGARYTHLNGPSRLVYVEEVPNRSMALKRELQIKAWTHPRKAAFVHESRLNLSAYFSSEAQNPSPLSPGERFCVCAPGRVNLLGEHVDYNDGLVLPMAIDRQVCLQVTALAEPLVHLHALDLDAQVTFTFESLAEKKDIHGNPLPAYALYPAGVAWALQGTGLELHGMEAVYRSTVPIGAGLSSSAAVEVAFGLAFKQLGGWQIPGMALVKLCQQAENLYVGVQSGLMDQFASFFGMAGHALCLDTRNLAWEPIPLPESAAFVIADSRVKRSLAGSEYNQRRADCEEALALLQSWLPAAKSLRDVSVGDLERCLPKMPERAGKRARHVVEEIARVQEAKQLLPAGDLAAFGALMYASHASLRDLYEVSCPELNALVEIGASRPGCLGGRLTGAGFGGCTIHLVERAAADAFIAALQAGYYQQCGKQAAIYLCTATQGAHVIPECNEEA